MKDKFLFPIASFSEFYDFTRFFHRVILKFFLAFSESFLERNVIVEEKRNILPKIGEDAIDL